jgi:hypothetical protein
MGVPEEVARFADDLRGRGVSTEITTFPSGAVMLDVRSGDRLFVLAYSPSWPGFGVDEVSNGEGFGANYRFGFPDLESAKAKVVSMLDEASTGLVRDETSR